MRIGYWMMIGAAALILSVGIFPFASHVGQAEMTAVSKITVGKDGTIRLPDVDYRKEWVALGTWAVDADEGKAGSKGLHVVYTQPETVAAYRKTGKFPNGAILIKELFSTTTDDMTTGTVSRANKTDGWFVMVKELANRFPKNDLWGDGWGWAYFDAKDPSKTTTKDYRVDCRGCHVPVKNSDWIYVQGYPVLKKQ
jgi:Cytochrome P460